jgi:hydrogenase maturation protease
VLLVGCEPETFGSEEGKMGLSAPVEAAVHEAVRVITNLVEKLLNESESSKINRCF